MLIHITKIKPFKKIVYNKLRRLSMPTVKTNDPDKGLGLKDEIIQRLKAHKVSRKSRIPMEQVAKNHDIRLK
jgi:hypothetical protein